MTITAREESPFEYQLEYDNHLDADALSKAESYKAMAHHGTWSGGMWWHPNELAEEWWDRAIAKNAGFKVVDVRIAEPAETR